MLTLLFFANFTKKSSYLNYSLSQWINGKVFQYFIQCRTLITETSNSYVSFRKGDNLAFIVTNGITK